MLQRLGFFHAAGAPPKAEEVRKLEELPRDPMNSTLQEAIAHYFDAAEGLT